MLSQNSVRTELNRIWTVIAWICGENSHTLELVPESLVGVRTGVGDQKCLNTMAEQAYDSYTYSQMEN